MSKTLMWYGHKIYSYKGEITAFKCNEKNGIYDMFTYNPGTNVASYCGNLISFSSWKNKEVYRVKEEGTEFTLANTQNYLEHYSGKRDDSTTPPGHQYKKVSAFVDYCHNYSQELDGSHYDTGHQYEKEVLPFVNYFLNDFKELAGHNYDMSMNDNG